MYMEEMRQSLWNIYSMNIQNIFFRMWILCARVLSQTERTKEDNETVMFKITLVSILMTHWFLDDYAMIMCLVKIMRRYCWLVREVPLLIFRHEAPISSNLLRYLLSSIGTNI